MLDDPDKVNRKREQIKVSTVPDKILTVYFNSRLTFS